MLTMDLPCGKDEKNVVEVEGAVSATPQGLCCFVFLPPHSHTSLACIYIVAVIFFPNPRHHDA